MNNHRLRSIIINLRHRLTDHDRKRLHFYVGNDVIRIIQDHPTLATTLNRIGSLIDQNRINNKELGYLINALDEIYCCDATKSLRDYQNRNCADHLNVSIYNLSEMMPPRRWSHSKSFSLHRDDNNYNDIRGNNKEKLLKRCTFVFVLLLLVVNTEVLFLSFWNHHEFRQLEKENLGFTEMIKEIKRNQNVNAGNLNQSEEKLAKMGNKE
ncbi:hypothetical protein I4U23_023047 [Adineta vaga]|nr:hypothetical protein I4U23_023047 [Adineta vaga]